MPIVNAITFGYADVTEELIAAGASVGLVEGSGVNLLHWATITNRWEIIPILVANGVPIDEMDGAGFTPLMYAATINFGEGHALEELIRAGADLTIENPDGLTALEQTRKLNYTHLATLLRLAEQQ